MVLCFSIFIQAFPLVFSFIQSLVFFHPRPAQELASGESAPFWLETFLPLVLYSFCPLHYMFVLHGIFCMLRVLKDKIRKCLSWFCNCCDSGNWCDNMVICLWRWCSKSSTSGVFMLGSKKEGLSFLPCVTLFCAGLLITTLSEATVVALWVTLAVGFLVKVCLYLYWISLFFFLTRKCNHYWCHITKKPYSKGNVNAQYHFQRYTFR